MSDIEIGRMLNVRVNTDTGQVFVEMEITDPVWKQKIMRNWENLEVGLIIKQKECDFGIDEEAEKRIDILMYERAVDKLEPIEPTKELKKLLKEELLEDDIKEKIKDNYIFENLEMKENETLGGKKLSKELIEEFKEDIEGWNIIPKVRQDGLENDINQLKIIEEKDRLGKDDNRISKEDIKKVKEQVNNWKGEITEEEFLKALSEEEIEKLHNEIKEIAEKNKLLDYPRVMKKNRRF